MNPKVILICRTCDEFDCQLHNDLRPEFQCTFCCEIHKRLRESADCCSKLGYKSDLTLGRQTSPPPKEPRVVKSKNWGFNNRGPLNTPKDVKPDSSAIFGKSSLF